MSRAVSDQTKRRLFHAQAWTSATSGRAALLTVRRALAVPCAALEKPPSGRTTLKFLVLLTGAAAMVAVLATKRDAHASATIIVNTGTDDSTSGDGLCSLRKAINNANAKSDTTSGDCNPGTGNDTIAIFVLSGTIAVGSPLPTIQNTLTIVGPGQAVPVNGGAKGFAIFGINSTATVFMNMLTIENGNALGYSGQGVVNHGTLNVTNCTIQFTTTGGNGGGIANGGTLNVSNSLFDNNIAIGSGGAIANDSGVGSVSNSTFVFNSAFANGGAIYNGQNQLFVVSNSTFSDNSANMNGASCYNDSGGVLELGGTIVAGAGAMSNECNYPAVSPVSDLGYNISDDLSCNLEYSDDTPGANGQTLGDDVDPELDPSGLQDNGGPTETIALQAGSPAIDAIPIALCPATDQRSFPRPDPEDRETDGANLACDVGAFESSPP